jgi:hypothetical protein
MRERREVEREIFEARQDLEENLDRVVHRVREDLAVGPRVRHFVSEHVRSTPRWIPILVASVIACGLAIALLRRRRA